MDTMQLDISPWVTLDEPACTFCRNHSPVMFVKKFDYNLSWSETNIEILAVQNINYTIFGHKNEIVQMKSDEWAVEDDQTFFFFGLS